LLAWRDPFGFHVRVRLRSTPGWSTITSFVVVAEDLAARLPAPSGASSPRGIVDKLVARFRGS